MISPHSKFLDLKMSSSITHVTDASFEADVLQSDVPVVVDFWAECIVWNFNFVLMFYVD